MTWHKQSLCQILPSNQFHYYKTIHRQELNTFIKKKMTLNLPKLPWVKVRTHLHVISNLCEIGTSIDSTLKDINQTHFSLFLSVTLPLPNNRWSTCVNQIRFDKWMIDCVDRKENPECCHIGCFSRFAWAVWSILGRRVGTNSYSVE